MTRLHLLALTACTATPDAPGAPSYPLETELSTTLQRVWSPLSPSAAVDAQIDDGSLTVYDLDRFITAGLGVERRPGTPWGDRRELAPDFEEGTERRSIAWFWQLADPQLIDEESPIRLSAFAGLYRPQGHLSTQVLEAHVRTAQTITEALGRPVDAVLVAGDMTDGSQRNELDWFVTALTGGMIDPDSGDDDDPVPGAGNDYNDPFLSGGIDAPWFAALGNHETQYIGGFGRVNDRLREASVGSELYDFPLLAPGFRDGSLPNAPLRVEGPTPPDEDRLVLDRTEVLQTLHDAPGEPAGHGLSDEDVLAARGWFSTHPVPEVPLRLVVLDTVNSDGGTGLGAGGTFPREQLSWLAAELDAAAAAAELVVVMSHHRAKDLLSSSPVSEEELVAVLDHPNMVVQICGHVHENITSFKRSPLTEDGDGFWELTLASTVDFPMQSRFLELVDEGNGYISIYATNVDHLSPEGTLAHDARVLAAAKRVFGDVLSRTPVEDFWLGDQEDHNVLVRVPIPADVAAALQATSLPTELSSLEMMRW